MKDSDKEPWPGPIEWGFRRLRLNVPIHWMDRDVTSPCGSNRENDFTTNKHIEDVTCSECLAKLKGDAS